MAIIVPTILPAFTERQKIVAHALLASTVATMMGRKLEEGDWTSVYCAAKGIPNQGWSNLNIDVMYDGLGVEQKMLCVRSTKTILEYCGTSPMHPSATRSIRVQSTDGDPTKVARDVLRQYAELIEQRREAVRRLSTSNQTDMRTGWLLWQESLREFLYWEEEMIAPDPQNYFAIWKESGGGTRKKSVNLWVYDNTTNKKRYSITTDAGAKIQPYFDVPAPNDSNLYYFLVQGEPIGENLIRIWVTKTTALLLRERLGSLDTNILSEKILQTAEKIRSALEQGEEAAEQNLEQAEAIAITQQAYEILSVAFEGVSDEHMMQLFAKYIWHHG